MKYHEIPDLQDFIELVERFGLQHEIQTVYERSEVKEIRVLPSLQIKRFDGDFSEIRCRGWIFNKDGGFIGLRR